MKLSWIRDANVTVGCFARRIRHRNVRLKEPPWKYGVALVVQGVRPIQNREDVGGQGSSDSIRGTTKCCTAYEPALLILAH